MALAFSTANRIPHHPKDRVLTMKLLSDFHLDDIFEAAAEATEEAGLNALLAAPDMKGRDGNAAYALPQDRLRKLLRRHRLLAD